MNSFHSFLISVTKDHEIALVFNIKILLLPKILTSPATLNLNLRVHQITGF